MTHRQFGPARTVKHLHIRRSGESTTAGSTSAGKTLSQADIDHACDPAFNPAAIGPEWYEMLRHNGIHRYELIQPYGRFAAFQLIEAGVSVGLGGLLSSLAFRHILRRIA